MTILTFFEQKYACSGICNPALFYYSLSTSVGAPSIPCLVYLRSEIGDSLIYLGIVSILGGIIMGLIWCCQYAMWRKYPDDDEPASNIK